MGTDHTVSKRDYGPSAAVIDTTLPFTVTSQFVARERHASGTKLHSIQVALPSSPLTPLASISVAPFCSPLPLPPPHPHLLHRWS